MVRKIIITLSTLLYALLIIYSSLSNLNNSTQFKFEHMDKVIHYMIYSIFSLLVYNTAKAYNLKKSLIITVVLTISFGVIIELCQSTLTTYRNFELLDIFANIMGTLTIAIFLNSKKHC